MTFKIQKINIFTFKTLRKAKFGPLSNLNNRNLTNYDF